MARGMRGRSILRRDASAFVPLKRDYDETSGVGGLRGPDPLRRDKLGKYEGLLRSLPVT